ncbi:MAG: fibronectin type III domain-containing protein, partial [Candidatus Omnitrophica bacterium]|nr:fibronectin type III domain-containing protein [Candidatus Omnitrophota bacterium]
LAKFTLFDDRGMMIDAFPAQVTAPMTTSAGVDIFVVPDMLHHLDMATVQLNSATPVYEEVEAHISYSDGTKMVLPLYGSGGAVMTTSFSVPVHVPFGMVSISVMTKTGTVLGSVSAQVIEYGDMGGPINIFLSNPEFAPYEMVKLNVDANWPLPFVPRAELFWDGGSQKIFLNGQVPGNRFTGEFIAPSDPVDGGKIEIRDDRDMVIGGFPLDHRSEGEGEIIVTPMPPVIGQPLSIKVTAPSIVDSAPMFRLIFDDGGQMELNAYGPIPGDTFTASLALLERPLRMIEIVHEGQIIESIPVEYLSMANFTFFVDIPCEVAPCMMTDVIVRADNYVPFTPYLSVDFEGRIVDVPLSKMSPMEFFGRMNVPCDAYFNSFNMQLFDPQGKLLWQKAFSHDDDITDGLLYLNAMPVDDTSVMLTWDMLSGIEEYEIRYGDTAALGQTMYVRGVSTYTVSGLRTGEVYFFEVAARKNYSDIMVSDIMQVIVGGTTRELNVQDNVINNDVYLTWSEYAGADMYRVLWGNAPAVYPNSEDMMTTDYYISDLIMGSYNYIKVQALQDGQVIGESR